MTLLLGLVLIVDQDLIDKGGMFIHPASMSLRLQSIPPSRACKHALPGSGAAPRTPTSSKLCPGRSQTRSQPPARSCRQCGPRDELGDKSPICTSLPQAKLPWLEAAKWRDFTPPADAKCLRSCGWIYRRPLKLLWSSNLSSNFKTPSTYAI